MKTLADFKRKLTVGTKLHTTYHQEFAGRDPNFKIFYKDKDLGIREISIAKSAQIAFKTPKNDGTFVDSYMLFPTAKQLKIIDENTVTIFTPDTRDGKDGSELIPLLTYKFV